MSQSRNPFDWTWPSSRLRHSCLLRQRQPGPRLADGRVDFLDPPSRERSVARDSVGRGGTKPDNSRHGRRVGSGPSRPYVPRVVGCRPWITFTPWRSWDRGPYRPPNSGVTLARLRPSRSTTVALWTVHRPKGARVDERSPGAGIPPTPTRWPDQRVRRLRDIRSPGGPNDRATGTARRKRRDDR
jgi:hypothetical protein